MECTASTINLISPILIFLIFGFSLTRIAVRAIFVASSPMRSKSVIDLRIMMIMRRSPAAGCLFAIIREAASSISISSLLTVSSILITLLAKSTSSFLSASTAESIFSSTKPPIFKTCALTASNSMSYSL